jgi:ankyrin repeat protein
MKMIKNLFLIFSFACISFYACAQDLNLKLYQAVSAKDTLQVEQLLNKGADANYKPNTAQANMNLLNVAVINKDIKSVKLLIDHKADINGRDWFNTTPLMYAANGGNLDIIIY